MQDIHGHNKSPAQWQGFMQHIYNAKLFDGLL